MTKNLLLLTATINPMAGKDVTRRADPAIRLADYQEALRFYLTLKSSHIHGIVFCENSGADLGSLEHIAAFENPSKIDVRFFSALSDCPPEYGKGHSELYLMDRAYEAFVKAEPETTRVWKVTGRLKITNMESLIATAPAATELYLDIRRVPRLLRAFGTDRWAETRIIGFTAQGYARHLLNVRQIVGTPNHQFVVEKALYPGLMDAIQRGASITPRFIIQPVMIGVGAESLKNYNDMGSKVKNVMRRFTRRFIPSLWL
jgi:hypothetical protein